MSKIDGCGDLQGIPESQPKLDRELEAAYREDAAESAELNSEWAVTDVEK